MDDLLAWLKNEPTKKSGDLRPGVMEDGTQMTDLLHGMSAGLTPMERAFAFAHAIVAANTDALANNESIDNIIWLIGMTTDGSDPLYEIVQRHIAAMVRELDLHINPPN